MAIVMTSACRSYSALTFDGCPGCVDAALDAVTQAGSYVLGQVAPSLATEQTDGRLEMAYRLVVRLFNQKDDEIARDELTIEQTISPVEAESERDEEVGEPVEEREASVEQAEGPMRLADFQTILDVVRLGPAGSSGAHGEIHGRLFGFERPIGRFEIEVHRGR